MKYLILVVISLLYSCTAVDNPEVVEAVYKGHDYLYFHVQGRLMGVTHNPECKKCYDRFD